MLRPKMGLLETFKIYLDIYRKLIGEIKKDTRLYFWQVKECQYNIIYIINQVNVDRSRKNLRQTSPNKE